MPENYEDLPVMPISHNSSECNKTGSWRTFTPRIDYSKCIKCNICWKFCPDVAIELNSEGAPVIRYDFCKGCGICMNECPVKAISMSREAIQ